MTALRTWRRAQRRWGKQIGAIGHYGSILLSIALLGIIVKELSLVDLAGAFRDRALPPVFWLAFTVFFGISPFIEWLMLRRLWQAPFSGFWAILRKMVYNELLISYLGDAYLFAWVRRELPHVKSPFGAVKDMAIISAFMGSATTLAAIAIAWPLFPDVSKTGLDTSILLALALPLASGGAIALFHNKLLSLPRGDIVWIGSACGIRIVAQAIAAIVMWWSLLPQVPMTTWIVLAAVRMVSTRLPLVPNKDLAFAAVTVALIGSHGDIAPVIVMITTMVLLANIMVAIGISLLSWGEAINRRRGLKIA
ncbi:MAG TPA: hypothetical protein VGE65_05895 [Sphingobium sp.]